MFKKINYLTIAVILFLTLCGTTLFVKAAESPVYTQSFSQNTAGLTSSTGEIITEVDGNKVLKLTKNQEATVNFDATTQSSVIVSYKLKIVNLVAQGGTVDFGSAGLGEAHAVQVVRYQNNLTAYNNSTDSSSSGSNNGPDLSAYADGEYHTVSYIIDFSAGTYIYQFDGVQIQTVRNLRTTGIQSIDTLYFGMKDNAEILYVDDINISEIVPDPVNYVQSFDDAETTKDIEGLSLGKGTATLITESDGNKALKVTGEETLTIKPVNATVTDVVEISYKIKVGTVNESTKYKDFGTVYSGTTKAIEAIRFTQNITAYNNSTTHATNPNSNQAICTLTTNQDDAYHTVTYYMNLSSGTYVTYFDGSRVGNTSRSLRNDGLKSVDSLYFDIGKGEEFYIDDVTIKDASLELRSSIPENGSKIDKMPSDITMDFTSRIATAFANREYFKLYENDKLLSDYTVTLSGANTVKIVPSNGFYGNCSYRVELDEKINQDTSGYAPAKKSISIEFETEGFLVSSADDTAYGGKVLTIGKTYQLRAGYTNQSGSTENPVLIIAKYKNQALIAAPVIKPYEVAAGDTLYISENYKAEEMDETTAIKVMLWKGIESVAPVSEKTVMIGEYADGTPAYEEEELGKLKEKYDEKQIDGFNIGLITDLQTSVTEGYETYHHHYKSLVKATNFIPVDCIADLGDAIDGGETDKIAEMNVLKEQTNILKKANVPVFRIKGNHDDNRAGAVKGKNGDLFITDDQWVETVEADWSDVMDGSTAGKKPYYYKDFPEDNIRVVAMDAQNIPYTYAGETNAVYNFGYSQEQLAWQVNEALDFTDKTNPSDWGVVFLMHTVPTTESANIHNVTLFHTIFQAFQKGNSGTLNRADDVVPVENLAYDFTKQGAMEVICILDGHTHKDGLSLYNGVVKITTTSSLPDASSREMKTSDEDAWDIVTIDRENRKIYTTRFGAGEDREISY